MLRTLHHLAFGAAPGEDTDAIRGLAAPGETVSLSFSLLADRHVEELAVEAGALRQGAREIPAGAVDLHVVHVWLQAGVGVYRAAPQPVPELLLKDDRSTLRDRYSRRRPGHLKPYRRPVGYVAPRVRLAGAVRTELRPGERKQVWVDVAVPDGAAPGVYRGHVAARRPGAAEPETAVAVELEVLPPHLADPGREAMLWFKGTLDAGRPQHHLTRRLFAAHLRDIRRAGFTSVSLTETDPRRLQEAVELAVAAGFRGRVVLDGAGPAAWERVDFGPLEPIVYVSDEVDAHGPERLEDHRRRLAEARAAGLRSMTSVLHAGTAARLRSEGAEPDVVSAYLPRNPELAGKARGLHWYWHAHMEKPDVHRLLAGALAFASGAPGISPYCYQHRPRAPFSAFDDFDEWEPGFLFEGEHHAFKDHMATYPARRGSIPTVQWRGMAAGLADLRHLATLDAALAGSSGESGPRAGEIRAELDRRLARLVERDLDVLSPTRREPCADWDPEELPRLREWVARASLELTQRAAGDAPSDAARGSGAGR